MLIPSCGVDDWLKSSTSTALAARHKLSLNQSPGIYRGAGLSPELGPSHQFDALPAASLGVPF